MRILGRLLLQIRSQTGQNDGLKYFMKPQHFDQFIVAAKHLGGFHISNDVGENVASFDTPSLPLKIGYAI